MSENNPYMPPAEDAPPLQPLSARSLNEASSGQRLLTLIIIDEIVIFVLVGMLAWFEVQQSHGKSSGESTGVQLATWGILVGYYILLEGTTGRTVGKLVMGTKVVSASGGVPTFGQIVGRSFARLVPFEPFSFLRSNSGWHDRWSGTRVVRTRNVQR